MTMYLLITFGLLGFTHSPFDTLKSACDAEQQSNEQRVLLKIKVPWRTGQARKIAVKRIHCERVRPEPEWREAAP